MKQNEGMGLDSDIEYTGLFFFPAPYPAILRGIARYFHTGKNIAEFADLAAGNNFDLDILRQERLHYK